MRSQKHHVKREREAAKKRTEKSVVFCKEEVME
jgi:hypothetical protein